MAKQLNWAQPTEKEIETEILYFLNYQVGILAFKVNTVGIYDQRLGIHRKLSKFVMPGTPDILACISVGGIGVFAGFEVKTPNGRQSPPQKLFQEKLQERANGFYFLVKSIKDVEGAVALIKEKTLETLNKTSLNELSVNNP